MSLFFTRSIWSIVVTAILYIPAWIYLLAKYVFAPTGFWQNIVLFGLAFWILGFIQFVLFIVWVVSLIYIWIEYRG